MLKLGNKIIRIVSINSEAQTVRLRFSDGVSGVVSLKPIFELPTALSGEVLKGNMFGLCFIESGALAWPNGFELCPDLLRRMLDEKRHKAAA